MFSKAEKALSYIDEAKSLWEAARQSQPTEQILHDAGLTAGDISRAFERAKHSIESIINEENIDKVAWQAKQAALLLNADLLAGFIRKNSSSPESIDKNATGICSNLWEIIEITRSIVPGYSFSEDLSPETKEDISINVKNLKSYRDLSESICNEVEGQRNKISIALNELKAIENNASAIVLEMANKKSAVEGYEREAGNAKINAESTAVTVMTEAERVRQLSSDLSEETKKIIDLIDKSEVKKNEIFQFFEDRRSEISTLLEGANKVGLARSFQLKRRSLRYAQYFWVFCFVTGIASLLYTGIHYFPDNTSVVSLVVNQPAQDAGQTLAPIKSENNKVANEAPVGKTTVPDKDPGAAWLVLLKRLLTMGPLVWFTWFSARQYTSASRMAEDYAFKEAAAMAYTGYRNEMATDDEMLAMLQKSAIKTYGENPAKTFFGISEPASPLHEAIEKSMEKLEPKEILDFIREVIKRDPK